MTDTLGNSWTLITVLAVNWEGGDTDGQDMTRTTTAEGSLL